MHNHQKKMRLDILKYRFPFFSIHSFAMGLAIILTPITTLSFAHSQTQYKYSDDDRYTKLSVIMVYAEKEDKVPQSLMHISRDHLDRIGTTDMASIVKYLPLVTAPKIMAGSGNAWDGTGTSGYNIRGVDGNRIGLDVDGVDLASVTTQPDGYKNNSYSSGRDFIDPEMFSDVIIQSGTTHVATDGLGGRVSFRTKSPDDYLIDAKTLAGRMKAGYSSVDDAWFSSVTAAAGNDILKSLIAYSHRDGHETKSNGLLAENPIDWTSDALLTRILWNFKQQQRLGFTFDYYKKDQDRIISADELSRLYPQGASQSTQAERKRVSLDYLNDAKDTVLFDQLEASVSYQDTQSENTTHAFYQTAKGYRTIFNDYREQNYQIKADAIKDIENHRIKYGLGINRITSNRPWVQINPNQSVTVQNRMVDSEVYKYWLYLADSTIIDLTKGYLDIQPSVRLENQRYKPKNVSEVLTNIQAQQQLQKKDNTYLAPSFAVGYQWLPNYYSYAKYNHGVRVPTAAEMAGTFSNTMGAYSYSILGNSNLKRETSHTYEMGIKSTSIRGLKFDLAGFYTAYNDFIDYKQLDVPYTGQIMTYQLQNIAKANIRGAELSLRLDLQEYIPYSEGMSVAFVAGKTKGRAKNDLGQKTDINSVQPEKASLTFNYDDPDTLFGLGLTATAVGSKTATQDATFVASEDSARAYKKVSGYIVYDLNTYWNLTPYIKLNVAFNNILDRKYWDYAAVNTLTSDRLVDRATMPGRNVVASIEFKY